MNVLSFQSVMDHTAKFPDRWEIAKKHMPQGKAAVMILEEGRKIDAELYNTWHGFVRTSYERQASEMDKGGSKDDTRQDAKGRNDAKASQYRGGATSTENDYQRSEEKLDISSLLTARRGKQIEVVERLQWEFKNAEEDLVQAEAELERINNALEAINDRHSTKNNVGQRKQ